MRERLPYLWGLLILGVMSLAFVALIKAFL